MDNNLEKPDGMIVVSAAGRRQQRVNLPPPYYHNPDDLNKNHFKGENPNDVFWAAEEAATVKDFAKRYSIPKTTAKPPDVEPEPDPEATLEITPVVDGCDPAIDQSMTSVNPDAPIPAKELPAEAFPLPLESTGQTIMMLTAHVPGGPVFYARNQTELKQLVNWLGEGAVTGEIQFPKVKSSILAWLNQQALGE